MNVSEKYWKLLNLESATPFPIHDIQHQLDINIVTQC